MNKVYFCLICLCSLHSFSQSKKFQISGTLISEEEKLPLESATIHLESLVDSTLVNYTLSDKDGKFVLNDKTIYAKIKLVVSYVGYEAFVKVIPLNKQEINLGKIFLKTDTNALNEIIITSTAPVVIKKDTLEFNAASFKTKRNANVEDVLKELPGVEVDAQGQITVNGKTVDKILVNGEAFFGNDPTITTRNLTKDVIEKIQITDTRTKAEAFAGQDGNQLNKTINFTIKEENNKGVFGSIAAGVGTDKRYEFSGMVNAFNNKERLSVLGGGNNINVLGFSFGDIEASSNFRNQRPAQGIITSNNFGGNYSNQIIDRVGLNSDYFYSQQDTDVKVRAQRENILPDSRFFSNSQSNSFGVTKGHDLSVGFEIEIDSTFLVNIRQGVNVTNTVNGFDNQEESLNERRVLTNNSQASSLSDTNSRGYMTDIDATKRLGSKGAFLKLNVSNASNLDKGDSELNSKTNFFDFDATTMVSILNDSVVRNQIENNKSHNNTLQLGVTYRFPIMANTLFLDASYNYNNSKQENKRSTFDFNTDSGQFNTFINNDLSSDFEYLDKSNQAGLELVYKKDKITARSFVRYISRTLDNKDNLISQRSLSRDFNAKEVGAFLKYKLSKSAVFNVNYDLNNSSPQLRQIQTFRDVSNPLNTVVGNPELEPTNNHRFNLRYRNFDFQKKTGFYAFFVANFVNNQIISKSTIDDDFARSTTFANVNGNFNIRANANFAKKIKLDTLGSFRYGLGLNFSTNKNINFNNDVKYASKNTILAPNARITFSLTDILELSPNYRLTYNKTSFDIEQFESQEFLRHRLGINTSTSASKRLDWRNNISYNYNPNVAEGFQRSAWFWNSTLSYSMFKEQGFLMLKVYDLLNQNTNASRISNANYIEDSQTNILSRYFMVNFSWKINGSKGESRDGLNRGFHG